MDRANAKFEHVNINLHKNKYLTSSNDIKEPSSKKESIVSKTIHKKEKSTNFESSDRNNNLYKSSKDPSFTEQKIDHKRDLIYNNIYNLKNDYSTDKLMSTTKKNIRNEEYETSIENGNFYDIKQKPGFKYITPAKKKIENLIDDNKHNEFIPVDSSNYNDYFSNLFVDNNSNDKKNVIISELEIEISVNSNNNIIDEQKDDIKKEKEIVNKKNENPINKNIYINDFHNKTNVENKNINKENKNEEIAQKPELTFKRELEEKLKSFLKLNRTNNSVNDKMPINNNTNSNIKINNNKHIKANKSDLIRTEGKIRKFKQVNSLFNNNDIIIKSNVNVNKLNTSKNKNINTDIKHRNKFELSFTKNININLNCLNKKNILTFAKQKQNSSSPNKKKKLINYKTNMNFFSNSNHKKRQITNIHSNASGSTLISRQRKIITRCKQTNIANSSNLSVFVNNYPFNSKHKKLILEKRKNSIQYKIPSFNNISSIIVTPHAPLIKKNFKKMSPESLNIKLNVNNIKTKLKNKYSDKKIKYNTHRSQDDKNQIIVLAKKKEIFNKLKNNSPVTEKNRKKIKKYMNQINIDIYNSYKNEYLFKKKELYIKNKSNKTESFKKNKEVGLNCIINKLKV